MEKGTAWGELGLSEAATNGEAMRHFICLQAKQLATEPPLSVWLRTRMLQLSTVFVRVSLLSGR